MLEWNSVIITDYPLFKYNLKSHIFSGAALSQFISTPVDHETWIMNQITFNKLSWPVSAFRWLRTLHSAIRGIDSWRWMRRRTPTLTPTCNHTYQPMRPHLYHPGWVSLLNTITNVTVTLSVVKSVILALRYEHQKTDLFCLDMFMHPSHTFDVH